MIPFCSFVGDESAPHLGFVLHGVLGSGNNFKSFIKRLVEVRPDYRFALVDLRYHGRSQGATDAPTIENAASDLFDLARDLGRFPRSVIGHSLGGKVALAYGRRHVVEVAGHPLADDEAHAHLKQIWTLDSDPGAQQPDHGHQVISVFGAVSRHAGPFPSRDAAQQALLGEGLSSGLVNWLLTSLDRSEVGFTWRYDVRGIEALLHDYFSFDLWPFLDHLPRSVEPAFELLVAENSDRWSGDMKGHAARLDAKGLVRLHVLPNSGHWVHVDNPTGLLEILRRDLI